MHLDVITGEKIQEVADVYFCDESYLGSHCHNTYIISQNKHKFISSLRENEMWDNPPIIYCYADWLKEFYEKIHLFKNDFILVTHNSDYNITESDVCLKIANDPKIVQWYAQNVCIQHQKLRFLPIGIANRQWQHGSLFVEFYKNLDIETISTNKPYNVYFNFQISTNTAKRQPCYDMLKDKLEFLPGMSPFDNFARLSQYKYCICPEGNGVDTHRLWEALYLKCVPIVLDSPFIQAVQREANLPLIILDSWEDFRIEDLPLYESFNFDSVGMKLYLSCSSLHDIIRES